MINTEETVRVTARPYNWAGVVDTAATVTFRVSGPDDTFKVYPMVWDAFANSFRGDFEAGPPGRYSIRVKSVMTDGSVSVESRQIDVKL